ncbi:MAG: DUF2059 domain-containing protein [Pseudomonadota bacterium]
MRVFALAASVAAALLMLSAPLATTGHAQDQAQTPTPADEDFTASHLRAAQEVVNLTRSDLPFDDILPRLADQTRTIFTRSNPAYTAEIEATVLDVAITMAPRRLELSRTIQLIWARRFSERELVDLAEFFRSPLGAKFTQASPVIATLSVGAARQWEEQMAELMVSETREKLREQGFAL